AKVPLEEDLGLVNNRCYVEQYLQDDLQQVLRVVEERVERARADGQGPGEDEQQDQRWHKAQQGQRVAEARKAADGHEDHAHADQEVIAGAESRSQRVDGQRSAVLTDVGFALEKALAAGDGGRGNKTPEGQAREQIGGIL